jgi:ribosomal protein S6
MKEYELTYLITSSFTKEEAENYHEKLKKEFSKKAKLSEKEQVPTRKALVYEINKESEGYLASFGFNTEEKDVITLEDNLKNDSNVMRYIIAKKRTRIIKQERNRGVKIEVEKEEDTKKEVKKKEVKKTSAPKKTELNNIDEKIEEIA